MYLNLRRAFKVLSVSAMTLILNHSMAAEPMTGFAGAYQLSNVVEDSGQVHLTLKLLLNNTTMTDIKGGIVVLMDSQPSHILIGKVAIIHNLPRLGHVTVSHEFTVSAAEYEAWQHGHEPVLEFLVPDSGGTTEVRIQARRVEAPSQLTN